MENATFNWGKDEKNEKEKTNQENKDMDNNKQNENPVEEIKKTK